MPSEFLLYGATGFVGEAIARQAIARGLRPVVAGRDPLRVAALAKTLGVEHRVFALDDPDAMDEALAEVPAVLHCAGPYIHTAAAMVDGCLRSGTHYLDITGELPVYAAIAQRDAEARSQGAMLLPGVGFDVVPTDCLALHLKQRLPSATHLALAFHSDGPAALPPGTVKTMFAHVPGGERVRVNGALVTPSRRVKTRQIDFGNGPRTALRRTWGDVFMAYESTGVPNIEDYIVLSAAARRGLAMMDYARPLFKFGAVRTLMARMVRSGSTVEERAQTQVSVWGEVVDNEGGRAVSRLHGPEAGVEWTSRAALSAVRRVLQGDARPGFQTPATAYGADFVLECEGVVREDVE